MNKIIKLAMWALMIIGVALTVYVFADNGSDASVNGLLYCAYSMLAIAIASIVYAIARKSAVNPQTLVRIGVILAGAVVLIGAAIALAPGTPAVGYNGPDVPVATLKLTDTILNLTYFTVGAAVLAIIASSIYGSVKK